LYFSRRVNALWFAKSSNCEVYMSKGMRRKLRKAAMITPQVQIRPELTVVSAVSYLDKSLGPIVLLNGSHELIQKLSVFLKREMEANGEDP
jgi:hypothetical protein